MRYDHLERKYGRHFPDIGNAKAYDMDPDTLTIDEIRLVKKWEPVYHHYHNDKQKLILAKYFEGEYDPSHRFGDYPPNRKEA